MAAEDRTVGLDLDRQARLGPVHGFAQVAAFRARRLVFAKALLAQRDALGAHLLPKPHGQPPFAAIGTYPGGCLRAGGGASSFQQWPFSQVDACLMKVGSAFFSAA